VSTAVNVRCWPAEHQFLLSEGTGSGATATSTAARTPKRAASRAHQAELEQAAREGVSAEVVISNGMATIIQDDH
jgi:hypothetical protein